jgi:hypothetical protein
MNELQLITMFCDIDELCKPFEPIFHQHLLQPGQGTRLRQPALALSEIMTIIVSFHWSHYRTFKHYYTDYVDPHLRPYFPMLVSSTRFVELMPHALVPLCCYLYTRKGRCTGIAFIDSTPLVVCHNRRIASHKVFAGWAARGKTSMGWFYGFKLHLIVNNEGELLAFGLTPGNVDEAGASPHQAAVWAALWGPWVYFPGVARYSLCPGARTLDQNPQEHEESVDAVVG